MVGPNFRLIVSIFIIIGLILPSFIETFTVYAEEEIDITYKTDLKQNKESIVEFSINNMYIGNFKLRTSPTLDQPSEIYLDYTWSKNRIEEVLGKNATISSVVIIYEIYEGNRSVAHGSIYNHIPSKITSISDMVRNAKELTRYNIKKLECLATIIKDGEIIGVVAVNFLQEIEKAGLDELYFIKDLNKHLLTLNPEMKDTGWIETDILRGSEKVGLIRFVGDTHFKDARLLYVTFQMFNYEMEPFYNLHLDINVIDTDSGNERKLKYMLLSGEEFFMPGNITLVDLGFTKYEQIKRFDITSFILTLNTPVTKLTLNATEKIGVIYFTTITGPDLVSEMKLKSSHELGNGWYYWQVSADTYSNLKNMEVVFLPIGDSVQPVFVKVVSYRFNDIDNKTLLLDILGLFDKSGIFDGNITLRTVLENYEVRDYSLMIQTQISQVVSQTKETIDLSNITGVHLIEKLELEIHRRENLLKYGLVPIEDELKWRETLEELKNELVTLRPYDYYIEYAFPIGQEVGKYDYVLLSYQYDLKPRNDKPAEITYVIDIRDEGQRDPVSILGASFTVMPEAEYWPSSFIGPRYVMRQSGTENMIIGYISERYDEEGRPFDYNFIQTFYVRFLNAENVTMSNVSLQFFRTVPPEIDFPYAYSGAVYDVLTLRNSLEQTTFNTALPVQILLWISIFIISFSIIVTVRSRRSHVK